MEIREKKREKCLCISSNIFLSLAIVSLLALSLVAIPPLARSPGLIQEVVYRVELGVVKFTKLLGELKSETHQASNDESESLKPVYPTSDVSTCVRSLRRRSSPYVENLRRYPIRRRLSFGPGSYPPRCMYKCGRCAPCYPVHVPVPPGKLYFPMEYYPEAWRCKCGNRLYMP